MGDEDVGTIDFGDSDEERLIVMQGAIQRHDADLYGNNGKPGLLDEFRTFSAQFNGAEKEREKQHQSNQNRLNLIIALLAMIAAYILIVVTLHPWKAASAFRSTIPSIYAAER